ncbi:histidine phosphatase family protein [Enterococcus sp. AZ109]|uniref:histidine phosphatase family protein n=1 Tax=Enterococcus sp. AZ109 TaxID=2774634 RepID=UPI003F26B3F8
MKSLYLMRHGETLFNAQQKVQGWCDSPLTEAGKEQALAARNYFQQKNIHFDHCYASTQERACDTLELVIGSQTYSRRKNLKEMFFGQFEGASTYLQPKGPESYESFYVDFGGESGEEVRQRILAELTDIMTNEVESTAIVVSHNGAIFYFLQQVLPENTQLPLHLANGGFMKFSFEQGVFTYLETMNPIEKLANFDKVD